MKTTAIIISVVIASIGVIAFGVASYFCTFHHLPKDTAVWGQLGDYLNMYVSAASLILISALTYVIHQADTSRAEAQRLADENRNTERDEEERVKNRPVLAFMSNRDFKLGPIWKVKNISNNVAINVLISFSQVQDEWRSPVIAYSLGAGEELRLNWISNALQIRAVYYDAKGNVITSTMQNDLLTVEPDINGLNQFGRDQLVRLENAALS